MVAREEPSKKVNPLINHPGLTIEHTPMIKNDISVWLLEHFDKALH